MIINKENIIDVIDEKGRKDRIEILKYFTLKSNNKDYIIYKKENKKNTDEKVFASQVIENKNDIFLKEIKESELINKMQKIMEDFS